MHDAAVGPQSNVPGMHLTHLCHLASDISHSSRLLRSGQIFCQYQTVIRHRKGRAYLTPAVMVELNHAEQSTADGRRVSTDDRKRNVAVAGAVIAAAAAAVALGRHLLQEQKYKKMPTFVLKADNGTEAHIRPLGCCIQRMLPLLVLLPGGGLK